MSFTKEILKNGSGPVPKQGQTVTVHADLFLRDPEKPFQKGTAIWSTSQPKGFLFPAKGGPQPFSYKSGLGKVIKGWDEGVATMQLKEKARLIIPWKYAYGADGYPGFKIPPRADLVFEIEVLKIA